MNPPILEDRCERPPTLAVRATAAAQMLGIGERLLATMTKQGTIPHVRMGRAIVYPVDAIRLWLTENSITGKDSKNDSARKDS